MVIAETKRQMHETLEMKEDEVAQLRSRLQQVTAHKEELQEQKEKAEKSGGYRTASHCVQKNPFLNVLITVTLIFLQHLKSSNGHWVSLRGRRKPVNSCRFSWKSR